MWPPGRFVHSNCYSGRLDECKHGDEKRTALKVGFFFLSQCQSGIYSFERHFTYEQLQIVSRDLRIYCPGWKLCKLSYGFSSKWYLIVKDWIKKACKANCFSRWLLWGFNYQLLSPHQRKPTQREISGGGGDF